MQQSTVGKTALLAISLVILSFSAAPLHHASATTTSTTGMIVPLYGWPSSQWTNLIQEKAAFPGLPIIAAVNPDNGPGWYQDSTFLAGVQRLQSAGITVVGYVYTQYASRSLASVESDVAAYASMYGLNGIYIDQMSNIPGQEWYYSQLTDFAQSLGMYATIGNPGADVPASYLGTVSTIVIYENAGLPSLSFLAGWHAGYSKSNFAIVAYGVSWLDTSYVASASNYLGYVYITDGTWPNPYGTTSSYISQLGGVLAQATSTYGALAPSGTTSIVPTGTTGTVSVMTVDSSGNEVWGLYTTLWQNGNVEQSCFSPCTFSVGGSQSYQVAVSDYGAYAFSAWADGTQSRFFQVSEPATPTYLPLTAVYAVG